jgi:hypothetical protein
MNNSQIVSAAFVDGDAHRELGDRMAASLYAQTQRPGYVRTLMFHMSKHWVSEFTKREWVLLARIKRHRRVHTTDREIVRALRQRALT